jgi:hypothetical protein
MSRWLKIVAVTIVAALGGATIMYAQQAAQPVDDKPLTEKWAPTEWGPNDKAGAVNRTTRLPLHGPWRSLAQCRVEGSQG